MRTSLLSIALFTFGLSAAQAKDFPLASCAGWNGTLVSKTGIDSSTAVMEGKLTRADFQEYCKRDPGWETTAQWRQTDRQAVRSDVHKREWERHFPFHRQL